MSAEEGVRSLARVLGLSSKRSSVYDDDAKVLICAEALNRIGFLEAETRRRFVSRREASEAGWIDWLRALVEDISKDVATLSMAAESDAASSSLTSSSEFVEKGSRVAGAVVPSASSISECGGPYPIAVSSLTHSTDGRGFDVEIVEATSNPGCVKVTPKRLCDLAASPSSSTTRRVRASPRVFQSPRSREAIVSSPLAVVEPAPSSRCLAEAALPPGRPETKRVVKGRASRRLSFDGQTEGECAQASGLCPEYTSPSVRRLKDFYGSHEDLRGAVASEGFGSPKNYFRRRRVQSLNAPIPNDVRLSPLSVFRPSPLTDSVACRPLLLSSANASEITSLAPSLSNRTSPSVTPLHHRSLPRASTPRRPDPTPPLRENFGGEAAVAPVVGGASFRVDTPSVSSASSRGSTPSIPSTPSVLSYRLAPAMGIGADRGAACNDRRAFKIPTSRSLPCSPFHDDGRSQSPTAASQQSLSRFRSVNATSAFYTPRRAPTSGGDTIHDSFRIPAPVVETHSTATLRLRSKETFSGTVDGTRDHSSPIIRDGSSIVVNNVRIARPSSEFTDRIPTASVSSEKVFLKGSVSSRASLDRGRLALPSPNSKAIRKICFSSPANSESAGDAAPPSDGLIPLRRITSLPSADRIIDGVRASASIQRHGASLAEGLNRHERSNDVPVVLGLRQTYCPEIESGMHDSLSHGAEPEILKDVPNDFETPKGSGAAKLSRVDNISEDIIDRDDGKMAVPPTPHLADILLEARMNCGLTMPTQRGNRSGNGTGVERGDGPSALEDDAHGALTDIDEFFDDFRRSIS